MILRLLQIFGLTAATFASAAEDGESQTLQDLRNEIAKYDSIKVSELLFPGCTGPFTSGFEINFDQKKFTFFSESAFGKRSESVVALDLTHEEIEDLNSAVLVHFERAVREKSINEQLMVATATGDFDAMKKLRAEHPVPIGGYPSLIIEIQIRRSDQSFSCGDQFAHKESWKAFTDWVSSLQARASRTDGANRVGAGFEPAPPTPPAIRV
jgi:hypothetical protein